MVNGLLRLCGRHGKQAERLTQENSWSLALGRGEDPPGTGDLCWPWSELAVPVLAPVPRTSGTATASRVVFILPLSLPFHTYSSNKYQVYVRRYVFVNVSNKLICAEQILVLS